MIGSYVYGSDNVLQETIWLDGTLPVGINPNGGTSASGSNTLRLYAGHLNEPRRLTDQSLNLYGTWDSDAFGVGAANYNPAGHGTVYADQRFPGQSFSSEDSTFWNTTRAYDPATGRYLQSDKIGLAGGINTYTYVLNNPANNTDLTGTQEEPGAPGVTPSFTGAAQAITLNPGGTSQSLSLLNQNSVARGGLPPNGLFSDDQINQLAKNAGTAMQSNTLGLPPAPNTPQPTSGSACPPAPALQ